MMVEVPEMLLTLGEIPRVTDERSPSSHSREGLKRLDGEDNSVNQLSLPVEIISGTVIMNSDENTIQLLSNEEQLIHADDDATKATREMRELLVVAEEEEEEEEEWFGSTTEEESEMKESVRSSAPTTDDDRTFKIYTISTTNGQHDSSKQLSQESKTTKDNMSSNECEHRPTMDDIREDHRDKNDGSAEASLSRASPLAEVFEQVGIKSKRHVHIQSTKILRELLETQGVRLEASVPREVVVTSVVTLWENHKK